MIQSIAAGRRPLLVLLALCIMGALLAAPGRQVTAVGQITPNDPWHAGLNAAVWEETTGETVNLTPATQGPQAYSGSFSGSGVFTEGQCSWNVTFTGTVEASITIGSSGVSGAGRMRGTVTNSSSATTCISDGSSFNEAIRITGSADDIRFSGMLDDVTLGSFQGRLIDNTIVGRIAATSASSGVSGSATLALTLTPR